MYGFIDLRPVSTPTSGLPLSKDQQPVEQSEKDAMKKHPYRHVIGSLRYLEQCTRPDIFFALNRLSRCQSNPGLPHWQELKHLCRYIAGTQAHMASSMAKTSTQCTRNFNTTCPVLSLASLTAIMLRTRTHVARALDTSSSLTGAPSAGALAFKTQLPLCCGRYR